MRKLPDGYGQIFRLYVFGSSGFWTMAPLRYAAECDPFLFLDCAPTPFTLAQSKKRIKFCHLTTLANARAAAKSPSGDSETSA